MFEKIIFYPNYLIWSKVQNKYMLIQANVFSADANLALEKKKKSWFSRLPFQK